MTTSEYYITGNDEKRQALENLGLAYEKSENSVSASAISPSLVSTDPNIDVRPHYHRLNYQNWRKGDAIPEKDEDIMRACRLAYEQVGLIRSVVDLMTEMAVEGLILESTNESTQNFYKSWSKRVHLQDRAERFANHYLVDGNVVCRRKVGEIDTSEVRRMKRRTQAQQSLPDIELGIIPVEYIFYDPSTIELIGGTLAIFSGVKQWAIAINNKILLEMTKINVKDKDRLLSTLPTEIRKLINNSGKRNIQGKYLIPIPSNRIYVAHNKKLDSQVWARSFIFSILHDVIYNEKLRLAKISALDGWHNALRLWKLGDHQNEILPSVGAFTRLADILKQHPGGILDILWDSMISMEAFYPPIEKLDNFNENFETMMLGLGVPRILVGGSEGAGVTNMFVGMKNLMKRINGVRRAIIEWIEFEIDVVNQNLGFREKPKIRFSYQDLFDNQTFFKLLLDLYDRQLVSDRSVLEKIGEHFDMQRQHTKEEHDLRTNDTIAPGNGPFWQPRVPQQNQDFQLEREEHNAKLQQETLKQQSKPDPEFEPKKQADRSRGRPPGTKDSVPRNRRFRAKSQLMVLADQIQERIDEIMDEDYLVYTNVRNKRQLTNKQKDELEEAKLQILASVTNSSFDKETLPKLLEKANLARVDEFMNMYQETIRQVGSNVTGQQIRMIKNQIFAELYINGEG